MLDPIVEEFRKIREESARRFNYDGQAMGEYLIRQQEMSKKNGRKFVDRRATKSSAPKSSRRGTRTV